MGRQAELATLQGSFVARARWTRTVSSTVVGDAGAGKSRLLYELRERLGPDRRRAAAAGPLPRLRRRRAVRARSSRFCATRWRFGGAHRSNTAPTTSSRACARSMPSLEPFIPLYLHLLSVPSESHPLPRHLQGEHLQAALLDALSAIVVAAGPAAPPASCCSKTGTGRTRRRARRFAGMAEIVDAHASVIVVTTRPEQGVARRVARGDTRAFSSSRSTSTPRPRSCGPCCASTGCPTRWRARARAHGRQSVLPRTDVSRAARARSRDARATARRWSTVARRALSLPDTVQAVIRARLDNLDAGRARRAPRRVGDRPRVRSRPARRGAGDRRRPRAGASPGSRPPGLIQQTASPEASYRFTHALTQEVCYDSLVGHQRKIAARRDRPRHRARARGPARRAGGAARPSLRARRRRGPRRSATAGAPPSGRAR